MELPVSNKCHFKMAVIDAVTISVMPPKVTNQCCGLLYTCTV